MEVDAVVDGSAEAAPDTSRKRPAVDETDETDGDATVQGSQDARAPPSAADAPANRGKKKRSRKKRRIDGQQDVGTPPGGRTPGVKSPGSGRGKKGKHEKKHRPATVEIEKRDGDLKVKMLQDAILKALLSTFPQSSRIKIWGRINRVVVIQVDGLTAPLLIKHSAHWRGLTGRFAAAHPFQIPGNTGYVYDVGQVRPHSCHFGLRGCSVLTLLLPPRGYPTTTPVSGPNPLLPHVDIATAGPPPPLLSTSPSTRTVTESLHASADRDGPKETDSRGNQAALHQNGADGGTAGGEWIPARKSG
eukprot:m.63861 g.63861  ORF g.63861 m.63861 type:complete len:303 (+) comp9685_c1_seq2:181-1089(+)